MKKGEEEKKILEDRILSVESRMESGFEPNQDAEYFNVVKQRDDYYLKLT